jgi:PAS domain S-box-containing protein
MFCFLLLLSLAGAWSPFGALAQEKTLIIVGDRSYAPFEFLSSEGQARGIFVDIWRLWSRKTGIPVEYRLMEWSRALEAVQAGKADAVGGMAYSQERAQVFGYSPSYYEVAANIFFHRHIFGLKDLEDLSGFHIGVVDGDYAVTYIKENKPKLAITAYGTYEDLIKGAVAGEVRVFITDTPVALFHLAKLGKDEEFKKSQKPLYSAKFYAAVKKGNTELLNKIAAGMKAISAEEIREIEGRWVGQSLEKQLPWGWLGAALGGVVFLIALVVVWNRQLRKRVNEVVSGLEAKQEALKASQSQLRQSEELFRRVTELSRDCIMRFDRQHRHLYVNEVCQQMSGIPVAEFVGKTHEELGFPPDLVSLCTEAMNRVFESKKPYRVEFELPTNIWVDWLLFPEMGLDDEVNAVITSARDITDRKKAEESLQDSENRYRTIFEQSRDIIYVTNADGSIAEINQAALDLFGVDSKEYFQIGASGMFADPADRDIELAELDKKGFIKDYELRLRRQDGSVIICLDTATVWKDEQGNFLGYIGTLRDITESKKAQQALRESEERNRAILEAAPDPMIVYDVEGKVVYLNPAFTRVFGWSLSERLGHTMNDFVPPESWPETMKMLEKIQQGESFFDFETNRYTKTGKVIPVCISGAGFRDEQGNPLGRMINIRDISETKRLEEQLLQAQKMEAVGTLAGGIAHDFNNILQAISGYSQLMSAKNVTETNQKGYLAEIEKAAARAAELVKRLLTFSRKVEPKLSPVDLNQEVIQAIKILERTLPKMIKIEADLAMDLSPIMGDATQLEQVILNLGTNASDAMPEGGTLRIESDMTALDEDYCQQHMGLIPGPYVRLTISDTGQGMDPDTLANIFDPFFTTKGVGKGTGLGLSMVYGIVKGHGGHIAVDSKPDAGTRFVIFFPLAGDAAIAGPEKPPYQGEAPGGIENILLVDDEKSILNIGRELLASYGYKIHFALSGEEALSLYAQKGADIDLVILDLGMPGIGGLKTLEGILKINPSAKVIIASGYSAGREVQKALAAGADDFIAKPFLLLELVQKVRAALDR